MPKPLSRMQERIAICKDAITQIKADRYIPAHIYFNIIQKPAKQSKSLQTVLCDEKIRCKVCAKGALFASWVRRHNEVTTDDTGWDDWLICETLTPTFSEEELDTIEAIFEGWNSDAYPDLSKPASDAANVVNAMPCDDDDQILIAILQSIVNKKGKLVATDIKQRLLKIARQRKKSHNY